MDDFLLLAQTEAEKPSVLRSALTAIDTVFCPLMPNDPPHRKEPASVKKMLKGDACWATTKHILGWYLNTLDSTLNLPAHRLHRLYELLRLHRIYELLQLICPPKRRVSVRLWHQLLGELRSMSPALPGLRGLFSALQDALGRADRNRVRITPHIWDLAADFTAIADSLRHRPTRLQELVPGEPTFLGASNASSVGMGGIWFSADPTHSPILWRQRFPSTVTSALVTATNPRGPISISDLELTAMIAHKDVLTAQHDMAEHTLWMATDNVAAVSWSNKGSATSVGPRAAYLLRYNVLHQRAHRYIAINDHIAGTANAMVDDASRLWQLSDIDLLTHSRATYPQALPWIMPTLSPVTNSLLIGSLFRRQQTPGSLPNESSPPPLLGHSGRPSAPASALTRPDSPPIPFHSCKSLPSNSALVASPAAGAFELVQWRKRSAPWGRHTPGWGPLTHASTPTATLTFDSRRYTSRGLNTTTPVSRYAASPTALHQHRPFGPPRSHDPRQRRRARDWLLLSPSPGQIPWSSQ